MSLKSDQLEVSGSVLVLLRYQFDLLLYVHGKTAGHVGTISYLTTRFLGKPVGDSLPVFSAYSFVRQTRPRGYITKTRPCNIQRFFTAVKMTFFG